jgi:uncharacterized membrane protein YfcA
LLSDLLNNEYADGVPELLTVVLLVLLGAGVATYGTLIGAGGGFLLAPLLLLVYPGFEPEVITAMSLGVVFLNAASGSFAYARQRRIDYQAGLLFAGATAPGALVGAIATGFLPRDAFEAAFGVLLLLISAWLLLPAPRRIVTAPPPSRYLRRLLTDAHGDTYRYSFDPIVGVALGLVIGFVSSLFGVGGGVVYVPAMILLLRFPAYVATATSTFTLMFTAGIGALVHATSGRYDGVLTEELALSAGALAGAQIGAAVSERLFHRQAVIVRLLSLALVAVGVRLLAGSLL